MNRQPGRDASARRVHNASDPGVATSEIAAYRAVATSGGGPSPEKRFLPFFLGLKEKSGGWPLCFCRDAKGWRDQVATRRAGTFRNKPGRDASARRVHNASDPGVATSEIAAYRAVATS
ncbi:hypothetical protein Taro_010445 [Colocasia esculenta]|uniref:Uncharacterized protein n=1 Tax=Colocasia esculenta TaxID=4460 RepID=A0A843U328_COLES|nr:hypothetical protein [Colocasia esculenta]